MQTDVFLCCCVQPRTCLGRGLLVYMAILCLCKSGDSFVALRFKQREDILSRVRIPIYVHLLCFHSLHNYPTVRKSRKGFFWTVLRHNVCEMYFFSCSVLWCFHDAVLVTLPDCENHLPTCLILWCSPVLHDLYLYWKLFQAGFFFYFCVCKTLGAEEMKLGFLKRCCHYSGVPH